MKTRVMPSAWLVVAFVSGVAASAILGFGPLATGVAADGKRDPTLDRLANEFAAAFTARDAVKTTRFYAEDGVVMPPNGRLVRGRRNIEAYYRNGFAQSEATLRLQPFESMVSGSRAFEAGTSSLVAGGIESAGKYVVVYQRVNNEWKIVYDIFNNDPPPPPASR